MSYSTPVASEPMLAPSDRTTSWEAAVTAFADAGTYWLATTTPDGRPHVAPVLAVWVDGSLHFATSSESRKGMNLKANARCVVTTSSNGLDLVLEGSATAVRQLDVLQRVADEYASKYDWHPTARDGAFHDAAGAPTAGPPPYDVYRVTPRAAFAYGGDGASEFSPTRWRF